jgi:hypothetical protein
MGIPTFGPNAVDWETRIDMDRLRTERLGCANNWSAPSSVRCWPSISPTSAT